MGEFIAWVGDPKAYNWITLVGSIAGLLTAFFTGYQAFLSRRDRMERVTVEWDTEYDQTTIRLKCFISNRTTVTLIGDRFRASGPISSLQPWWNGRVQEKHESWSPTLAPAQITIDPGKTEVISAVIYPDPSLLRNRSGSWTVGSKLVVSKVLWKLLGWRVSAGPKFSITLTVLRRSSQMRPIRFTHTIRVYPAHAIKIAENIEAKADKT